MLNGSAKPLQSVTPSVKVNSINEAKFEDGNVKIFEITVKLKYMIGCLRHKKSHSNKGAFVN